MCDRIIRSSREPLAENDWWTYRGIHSRITIYMVYRHEDRHSTNSQTSENLSSGRCSICIITSKWLCIVLNDSREHTHNPLLTYTIYILHVICIYLHVIYTLYVYASLFYILNIPMFFLPILRSPTGKRRRFHLVYVFR